jgi:uncharacterized damage-inducible protein DinB
MNRALRTASFALAATLLLATPALRAAASTPAPAAQLSPAQVLDSMLTRYANEMVPLVQAMPADKFNFAPTNGQFTGVRTFAQQVEHVAEANYHYFGSISPTAPKIPDMASLKTKDQIVQALEDSIAYGHQVIATITPQNAFTPMGTGRFVQTRAGTAAAAIAHGYNHYGQLVEYLRMNGIIPPASRHSM